MTSGDFCRRRISLTKERLPNGARTFAKKDRGQFSSPRIFLLLTEGRQGKSHIGNRDNMSKPSDLVQGTLDFLLLKILAVEPLHGFAISRRLRHVSDGVLQVSDGSLYPALHKLEQKGWISAQWKPTENNRRAKFYALTKIGRKHLSIEAGQWDRLSTAIFAVMNLKEA